MLQYLDILSSKYSITCYSSKELADINSNETNQEIIHQQFINGGIEKAVSNLIKKESGFVNILAFSIGGTIAWKANLSGLKTKDFWAVSSTRLRYETKKTNCMTHLIFGEKDLYKPDINWFNLLKLEPQTIPNKGHELYTDSNCIRLICKQILSNL